MQSNTFHFRKPYRAPLYQINRSLLLRYEGSLLKKYSVPIFERVRILTQQSNFSVMVKIFVEK